MATFTPKSGILDRNDDAVEVYAVTLSSDDEQEDENDNFRTNDKDHRYYIKDDHEVEDKKEWARRLLSKQSPMPKKSALASSSRLSMGKSKRLSWDDSPQVYTIDFFENESHDACKSTRVRPLTSQPATSVPRHLLLESSKQITLSTRMQLLSKPRASTAPEDVIPLRQQKLLPLRTKPVTPSLRTPASSSKIKLAASRISTETTPRVAKAAPLQSSRGKGVRVVLRCCPPKETTGVPSLVMKSPSCVELSGGDLVDPNSSLLLPTGRSLFSFDRVLGPDSSQDLTFSEVLPVVERFIHNKESGAVIAYGQTATGKTHTMGLLPASMTETRLGCIPRAITRLFRDLPSVEISAYELYLDRVKDLLLEVPEITSNAENVIHASNLNIREKDGKIYVQGLVQRMCDSAHACWTLIRQAAERRERKETELNKVSSRSHTVVSITHGGAILSFVDLAGSERVSRTFADAREAGFINGSLSALGNCVRALTTNAPYVPFRDSKLTRLLQGCLVSGNTVLFATVSVDPRNALDTLSTLKFAQRCSRLPVPAEDGSGESSEDSNARLSKHKERCTQALRMLIELAGESYDVDEIESLTQGEFEIKMKRLYQQIQDKMMETKGTAMPVNYEEFLSFADPISMIPIKEPNSRLSSFSDMLSLGDVNSPTTADHAQASPIEKREFPSSIFLHPMQVDTLPVASTMSLTDLPVSEVGRTQTFVDSACSQTSSASNAWNEVIDATSIKTCKNLTKSGSKPRISTTSIASMPEGSIKQATLTLGDCPSMIDTNERASATQSIEKTQVCQEIRPSVEEKTARFLVQETIPAVRTKAGIIRLNQVSFLEPLTVLEHCTAINTADQSSVASEGISFVEPLTVVDAISRIELDTTMHQVSFVEPLTVVDAISRIEPNTTMHQVSFVEPLTVVDAISRIEPDTTIHQVSFVEPLTVVDAISRIEPNTTMHQVSFVEPLTVVDAISRIEPDTTMHQVSFVEPLTMVDVISRIEPDTTMHQVSFVEPLTVVDVISRIEPDITMHQVSFVEPLTMVDAISRIEPDTTMHQVSFVEPLTVVDVISRIEPDITMHQVSFVESLSVGAAISRIEPGITMQFSFVEPLTVSDALTLNQTSLVDSVATKVARSRSESNTVVDEATSLVDALSTELKSSKNKISFIEALTVFDTISCIESSDSENQMSFVDQLTAADAISRIESKNVTLSFVEPSCEIKTASHSGPRISINQVTLVDQLSELDSVSHLEPDVGVTHISFLNQLSIVDEVSRIQQINAVDRIQPLTCVRTLSKLSYSCHEATEPHCCTDDHEDLMFEEMLSIVEEEDLVDLNADDDQCAM